MPQILSAISDVVKGILKRQPEQWEFSMCGGEQEDNVGNKIHSVPLPRYPGIQGFIFKGIHKLIDKICVWKTEVTPDQD